MIVYLGNKKVNNLYSGDKEVLSPTTDAQVNFELDIEYLIVAGGGAGGFGNGADSNTNFGGGGGSTTSTYHRGGSGVVIIRYSSPQIYTGGTITTDGGFTIHKFTTSGTLSPL
jgi:hypothetical protein